MGLTLHYTLRLPGELPRHAVLDVIRRLHEAAGRIPFPNRSPIFEVAAGEEIVTDPRLMGPVEAFFRFRASAACQLFDEEGNLASDWDDTVPRDAFGFTVEVGEGSESASFGFTAPTPRGASPPTDVGSPAPPTDWHWDGFCKTQYASNVSEDHFVKCHTSLVALLDAAVRLGVRVKVSDEGEYWDTRDVDTLLARLRRLNHIMAMFAGHLRDSLPETSSLEAPIFDHPRFERLEMDENG